MVIVSDTNILSSLAPLTIDNHKPILNIIPTYRKELLMHTYNFTILIERQPEGEYLVSVPALPGCYTEGRTLEEARFMATDAIQAYCASLLKHGEPIPVEPLEEQFFGRVSVELEAA